MEKRKATFDYVLADLIGRSVARVYNSDNKLPTLAEAYPTLFDDDKDDEALQQAQDEVSALRFKLFAQSFNNNFKGGKTD
jgi:site-specific recombinase